MDGSRSRIKSLSSLQTALQSVDVLHEAVENPMKLFVMLSSLLDEHTARAAEGQGEDVGDDDDPNTSLPVSVLTLVQDAIPLLKDDAEMLFGCVVSSVISCFADLDLTDEVCRTLLMFTKFYNLQLFIVDAIVSHGMENDDLSVRLMCVKIIPRLLKGLRNNKKPAMEEMFGLILEGTVGRVRDISDEVVQASLDVLRWMWRERQEWFDSKIEELGGLHEDLVNYYADQIFVSDGSSLKSRETSAEMTRSTGRNSVKKANGASSTSPGEVAKPSPGPLVFGFLTKKTAQVLQQGQGKWESIEVANALKKASESFSLVMSSGNISRESLIPTLPLFTDLVLSHVTSSTSAVAILALNLVEQIASYSPQTFSVSMDAIMPFFISLLSHKDDDVTSAVFRIMYRLCELLSSGLVLSHVSPAVLSSSTDKSAEGRRFLINAVTICCAGLLVVSERRLDFDTGGLMSELVVLLDHPDTEVR